MHYPDGREVHVGDVVQCWPDCFGVVVVSLDNGEFSSEYPEGSWSYLGRGVLIDTNKTGLIHYTKPDPEMELIRRAGQAETPPPNTEPAGSVAS